MDAGIVELSDGFETIEAEWDALASAQGASPFLRPGWFRAWWGSFGRGTQSVLVLRDGDSLRGVAPLCRHDGVLAGMADQESPEFGLIAADRAARHELVRALLERDRLVELTSFDPDGPDAEALRAAAREAGRIVISKPIARSPYVAIEGSWADFERSLDGKFVSGLRRRRRQLEREGDVTVEIATGGDRLGQLLEEGFRVEASGWKDETSIATNGSFRTFFTELARWAALRGTLRLSFLRVDGRAIAFELGLEEGGTHYGLKGGYDPEFRRYAPAKLLIHALLEHAFRTSLQSFEFLGTDEAWKRDWTRRSRARASVWVLARSPRGLARAAALTASHRGRPLAKRALAWCR